MILHGNRDKEQELTKGNKYANFLIPAAVIFTIYSGLCIPNTIKINKELVPLKKEFINRVEKGPTDDFEYGGDLESIVKKRNEYLSDKFTIPGKWIAHGIKKQDGNYLYTTEKSICYNPFVKITPYENNIRKDLKY